MNQRELARTLHKRTSAIGVLMKQGMPTDPAAAKVWLASRGVAPKAGRTLSDFRDLYDKSTIVPKKVRQALRSLGGGWEYEVQFAKVAGVSLADLSAFRDAFAPHVVQLREGRRAWAGTEATAKAMRAML